VFSRKNGRFSGKKTSNGLLTVICGWSAIAPAIRFMPRLKRGGANRRLPFLAIQWRRARRFGTVVAM